MYKQSKILILGHTGLVGSSLLDKLRKENYHNVIFPLERVDLTNQQATLDYFKSVRPEYVFICAAKVGGIHANNTYRADFIYQNLMIVSNIIHSAHLVGVEKVINLGSSCIYPRNCEQPIKEEYLLTSELEKTNEPYAIAKIAGLKMIENYNIQYGYNWISAMPTNMYGIKDNFDLETSHVLPAIIRKIHIAKKNNTDVVLWGTGSARREFLYNEDLADALVFLANNYTENLPINIGCGKDLTIKELAYKISNVIGFENEIKWDSSKPDGTPQKLLDVTRINELGWSYKTEIDDGLKIVYCAVKDRF